MPTLALPLEDYLEAGNKASPRGSSHGLDSLIAGQNRSKRVQNWMGFKPLGGLWQPSNNHGRDTSIAHAGLGYSTQWAWDSGPQQLYVASQPSQAPQGGMVKAAVAHRPDLWVSSAVINAVNGVTPTRTNTSVTHVNLMPEGGTKVVDIGPEKYTEKYSYAGMPTEYPRVGYAVPDGCTIERTANGRALRFLTHETGDGVQYMHTQDAYGWWGAPEVSMLMPNTGGVELVPQGTQLILGRTYHIFDLVPVAAEWAASFGQVHIDPSLTVGHGSIEDNFLWNAILGNNYGANNQLLIGNTGNGAANTARQLLRYDETEIPSDTITLHQVNIWRGAISSQSNANTGKIFSIATGRPWGVGVKNGSTAGAGESAWSWYANPTGWWSSQGAGGVVSDYDATHIGTMSWPAYTSGPDVESTFTLANAIAKAWRDATHDNEGMKFQADDESQVPGGSWFWARSTEYSDTTKRPSIYFEYAAATTGLFRRGIGRGIGRGIMRGM